MSKRRPRPEHVSLPDTRDVGALPWGPIAAGVGAGAIGVAAYVGLWLGQLVWLAPLGIGAIVGLAVMFTDRVGDKRLPWAAAGITIVACWVGYVIVEQGFRWQQRPPLTDSILAFMRDVQSAVLALIGGYMAWVVASRAGKMGGGGGVEMPGRGGGSGGEG
jgi:hypothetical protein